MQTPAFTKRLRTSLLAATLTLLATLLLAACQKKISSDGHKPAHQSADTPVFLLSGNQQQSGDDTSDWTSGGGYAPNDQFNPWFLHNTKKVHYCIVINEEEFGLDRATAKKGIEEAFAFWKKEFQLISTYRLQDKPTRDDDVDQFAVLGTQEFLEEPGGKCRDSTDVRFQLGVLSESHKRYIKNPKNYLGIAIRTNYDTTHLKGKGVIYIAPAKGALRPDLLDEDSEDLWRVDDSLLYRIMAIHETGHLFGLTNSEHLFMPAELMFGILKHYKGQPAALSSLKDKGHLSDSTDIFLSFDFFPQQQRVLCLNESDSISVPLIGDAMCLRVDIAAVVGAHESLEFHFAVLVSRDGSSWRRYARGSAFPYSTSIEELTKVYLSKQQRVFQLAPDTQLPGFIPGPYRNMGRTSKGTIQFHSSTSEQFDFWQEGSNDDSYLPEQPVVLEMAPRGLFKIRVPHWEAHPSPRIGSTDIFRHLTMEHITTFSLDPLPQGAELNFKDPPPYSLHK